MSFQELIQSGQRSVTSLTSAVKVGKLLPSDIVGHFLSRIDRLNPKINAIVFGQGSLKDRAQDHESRSVNNTSLPLAGTPVVVKDNIAVKGWPLTCGSKILSGYISPFNATVIDRLVLAGAAIIGKSNLDEFAMGSSTEYSSFGPTKNPWSTDCVPGGSSGGSAAAVAAGLAPFALGSDTGGSIRQPASFCGIVGFKPTYGRVSRYGLVSYGSSLDQIGPMANNVKDAAIVFDVISGHDPCDSTSLPDSQGSALASIEAAKDLRGKKIGMIVELNGLGVHEDIISSVKQAAEVFRNLGASLEPVSVPSLGHCVPAYYILATAEASANLARFDGVRYGQRVEDSGASINDIYRKSRSSGFGDEVKKRILLGTFVLSAGYYDAYYGKAMAVRKKITTDLEQVFTQYDLLLSPTAPTTAYKIGEKSNDPLSMYLGDICTISANLAGSPALSVPCGFDKSGLPIGLQLMGAKGRDELVLTAGHLFEMARGSHGARLPLGFG